MSDNSGDTSDDTKGSIIFAYGIIMLTKENLVKNLKRILKKAMVTTPFTILLKNSYKSKTLIFS